MNLNHGNIKLSWLIDWKGEEVLFNVQNVFTEDYKWFYFGFSKRGDFEESDLCFFQINSGVFGVATVGSLIDFLRAFDFDFIFLND